MKTKSILIKSQITGLLLLAGELVALNTDAQDQWTGGGNGTTFGDGNNWSSTVVPTTGDSLEFGTAGSFTTLTNDLIGYAFPSITYDASGLGFTIKGNAFTNGTSTAGTIITVNSANAQTISNNITLGNNNQTINLASGNLILGGVLSGAGTTSGLTLTGSGTTTLTLSGTNTYGSAGATTNSAGTIKIGNASALGASRLYVAQGATVDLNGNNLNVAFINNVGALTGGNIDNVSAGGNVTLKVGSGQGGVGAASGTYTAIDSFSGIIKNTTGTVGLTKVTASGQTAGIMATAQLLNGPAVLRLMNANTYTGPTTVNGGILELNFNNANNGGSAITANIISSSSALVMAGGDLIVDTPTTSGGAGAQTFAGLTLNPGASHLAAYRPTSGSASLTLGGITRNAGSTVDFQSRPQGGSSNQKIGAADGTDNTTNVNANFTGGQQTILGGYATWNSYFSSGGGTWAAAANNTANASKSIGGLGSAGYTTNTVFTAGKDMDVTNAVSTPAAITINSLRFNTTNASTAIAVNSSGNIVVATGGILETLTVANNTVAINNNNLTSGNGQDLIIHQYNTGAGMTIGANIVDNGGAIGLTKSGPGALTLTPNTANTFTGPLTLNAGTTTLGGPNALNGVPALVFGGMSQTMGGASPTFTFANGTLNLNGNSVSVASLTASADSSGPALVQNANAAAATLTVNGSATTSFTGTLQDGTGGGALTLIKSGSGSQTIGGTLSYSGSTTVSAGTLALTTTPSATPSYAVNGTLNVTALGSNTLALASPQTLSGSGTVSGNVTVASGAHTRPGATGVTNTISGNLTYSSGAKADFDVNTSATTTPSDKIVLSGASSVLTCGGVAVNINLMGASLDSADYVLFQLTGGSASISGTFNAVPTWLGTVPGNAGHYSIVTDTVNKKVILHYTSAIAPVVVGAASPATVVRNQSTFVSVTNTPGGGTITNVYLDLSLINGSSSVPLTLSSVANVYTNTIIIPAAAPLGSTHVVAYATDTTPLSGSGNIALTIIATSEVWNGNSGVGDNWTTNENWTSVLAPGLIGDAVTFDGTTRPTPDMDNSYSVTSLTFPATAGAFTIGTANGSMLTLTGPVTNNSTSAQILNVPVAITATQVVNTAAGDITLGSAVSGGGLTKVGNYSLYLGSSGNAYTGTTTISNGTVSINSGANIGSGQITLAGGILASGYTSTRLTLGNNINVPAGNTGTIVMSALNRYNGTFTGSGTLNINAAGTQDDIGGSWNTYAGQINIFGGGTFRLIINGGSFNGFDQAVVTLTNVSVSVSDNSGGNTINVGALTVDSTATLAAPYQGSSPLYVIGALGHNDYIGGTVTSSTRITKTGSGTLTIDTTATANYTGPTWVNGGTLSVLGTISASPMTNYAGATVAGTGTLYSLDLETNSTVSAGVNNYGPLTCSSDLTFNGGTNLVQISTTNSDLITVGGNLNLLSGTVRLVVGNTLTNGTYKLIGYTGTLTGSAGNLTLSGFSQSGQTAVLSDATANEIDLIVANIGGANLIWASAGAQDNIWNIASSVNWSNGPSLTTFTPSDHVTFNNSGAGNNPVDVRAIVQPSTTLVTGSSAYVFESTTGGGKLSGATNSLVVSGTGSLELDILSDYGGPTTIGSGSTLTVGNGAISASIGSGLVTNNGTLVFNQTNNISLTNIVGTGAGTLTKNGASTLTLTANNTYDWTTIGSGATVQVGTGGATGSLGSGAVTNDGKLVYNKTGSFTVANIKTGPAAGGEVDFTGAASVTLNNGNTYINNTVINNGLVTVGQAGAIPSAATVAGSTGWLVLDGGATAGTLDMYGFNQSVNALSGNNGTVNGLITNSATLPTTTNTLTVLGSAGTTYWGTIAENTNGGSKIALTVLGANQLELRGANTYSGGTIVGDTATLALHNNTAAGYVAGVSGGILMSNATTLRMNAAGNSGDPSIFPGNAVTIVDGATVTFTSQQIANGFSGTVVGSATATNVIGGGTSATVSFSSTAVKQFQSLLGTVVIPSDGSLRWSANTTADGGDFTTFDVEGTMSSKAGAVSLGALTGAGIIDGGGTAGAIAYTIGLKNIDTTFSGTIRDGGVGAGGIISFTKSGTHTLILSGPLTYSGSTTVSDGTLALVEPTSLDSNATINVRSSTATIDVSGRTDGTLNLGNSIAQTLNGIGTITGNLNNQANSTVKVGLGVLNVSGTATLAGPSILQLNRTNIPATNSEIVATSFAISGPLTVTNVGPALQGGDTFKLFSMGVSGFTATNLPALTGSMYWSNSIAFNGTITVINPINPNPPRLQVTVGTGTMTIGWPTNAGWILQSNSVGLASSSAWFNYPANGAVDVTNMNITMDPAKTNVFFRMVKP